MLRQRVDPINKVTKPENDAKWLRIVIPKPVQDSFGIVIRDEMFPNFGTIYTNDTILRSLVCIRHYIYVKEPTKVLTDSFCIAL